MLTILNCPDDVFDVDDLISGAIEADQIDVEMDELMQDLKDKDRIIEIYKALPHHCSQLLFLS